MHRIDTPTAQVDKFGQGKNGFTNGDPATGRRATDLNSDMWDAVQEEICTAIESAGLTLDKTKHDQLYQAIVQIITSKIPDALLRAKNLSDVVDKALARANLGLKNASVRDVGTKAGTVAAGDDERIIGAVQRAGDEMAGSLAITDSTALRLKQKDVSTLFRFDGTTFYLMFTKKGDPDGGYNNLRPFYVDANTGAVTFGNLVKALAGITANSITTNSSFFIESDDRQHIIFQNKDGTPRAYIYKDRNSDLRLNNGNEGGGDFVISRTGDILWGPNGARLSYDGNLYGSVWGGWLSNWLTGRLGAKAEINWVQSNFITDVALGAEGSFIIAKNAWQRAPAGCVLTGYNAEGNEPVNDTLFYRPIQKYVPTVGWMVIGHTA
ncbi:hypothetical protein ACPGAX_000868 [Enterobacter quasiroggenkampii]